MVGATPFFWCQNKASVCRPYTQLLLTAKYKEILREIKDTNKQEQKTNKQKLTGDFSLSTPLFLL